ncbi:MAG: glycine dehydrogenase (decarboxylating) subunit 1 [Firmicutes bacterium]|nr:glycine dehydrogenase (decarboxylating) subunit 1 [Bacillota bacterium]
MAWSYLPHTREDRELMCKAIGIRSTEELFSDIPVSLRLASPLKLPPSLSEPEVARHLSELASANKSVRELVCFRGGGAYDHYIPSVASHILSRSEFYSAYTQYQPEISQGYLQALWEYQSMISELTGMEVANASMYDGGTALAEAAMMACAAGKKDKILVGGTLHPHYREVLVTYARDQAMSIIDVPPLDGIIDLDRLGWLIDETTAAIIVQSPNFLGNIENLKEIGRIAHAKGAFLIASVDPISLGVLEAPGVLGADIVVGEGQSLGLGLNFGGPYLGFFATTEKFMRKMPGRIVGQTTDNRGNRGFVLTLQAREQHIRRNKATSNICSNEALCALAAAIYMSALGKTGFREVSRQCLQKAHYTYSSLTALTGCEAAFTSGFFKEFSIKLQKSVTKVNEGLLEKGILGGIDLGGYYPELEHHMLICVTEKRTKEEIDQLAREMEALI